MLKHNEIVKSIQHIRPNAAFVVNGLEIIWLDEKEIQPGDKEIEAGYIAYQAKVKADLEAEQAKKAAAEAKLAAIGLNSDDLKALGL